MLLKNRSRTQILLECSTVNVFLFKHDKGFLIILIFVLFYREMSVAITFMVRIYYFKFKNSNQISQKNALDKDKITEKKYLCKSNAGFVEMAKFCDVEVAIKSLHWKYSESMAEVFKNEISTFQILQERREKNDPEENKSLLYLVDFVGFILNDSCDPCFGSIVTQWYPMDDLSTYSHDVSNAVCFTEEYCLKNSAKKLTMPNEIIGMLEIARQIATGFFYFHNKFIFKLARVCFANKTG